MFCLRNKKNNFQLRTLLGGGGGGLSWKYHARRVLPCPISFRTSKKFLFTCPGTYADEIERKSMNGMKK